MYACRNTYVCATKSFTVPGFAFESGTAINLSAFSRGFFFCGLHTEEGGSRDFSSAFFFLFYRRWIAKRKRKSQTKDRNAFYVLEMMKRSKGIFLFFFFNILKAILNRLVHDSYQSEHKSQVD